MSKSKNNGWRTFMIGILLTAASIYGIYWWFSTSDCVTSVTVAGVVQQIEVSDNLKPLMCMTQGPSRYILTTAVAIGFLAGFSLIIQGIVKISEDF